LAPEPIENPVGIPSVEGVPLGITIIGGLIVSQLLTLYTTPVVYLYFNRVNQWLDGARGGHQESEPVATGRATTGGHDWTPRRQPL
jgi:hypothetical protein